MSKQLQDAKQSEHERASVSVERVSIEDESEEYSEEEITDEEVQALLEESLNYVIDDDPILLPRIGHVFYHRSQLREFINTMTRINADSNLPPLPPIETAIREERPGERHPHRYIYYTR